MLTTMSFELIFGLSVVVLLNIAEFKRILSPSKIVLLTLGLASGVPDSQPDSRDLHYHMSQFC